VLDEDRELLLLLCRRVAVPLSLSAVTTKSCVHWTSNWLYQDLPLHALTVPSGFRRSSVEIGMISLALAVPGEFEQAGSGTLHDVGSVVKK
jgi:hypothetical protein